MDISRVFVANLPGWPDDGVVIAAGRAGAEPVVNLEGIGDVDAQRRLIERVGRFVGRPFSVKLDAESAAECELVRGLPADVCRVFAAWASREELAEIVGACGGREVWLEATSVQEAQVAVDLGLAGVLAKGHEAGGAVGEESVFVLLQRLVRDVPLPVIAQGGVGRHSAAAVQAAGAFGVWLDVQVSLTPESSLPEQVKDAVKGSCGDETVCLGQPLAARFRIFRRPGMNAAAQADDEQVALEAAGASGSRAEEWRKSLSARICWAGPDAFWPLGQDVCLAAGLARDYFNVAGIVRGIAGEVFQHLRIAHDERPWRQGSPLAASHGTKYPLLQGPMTRVSDCAPFALDVAQAGGLPFLALALLRGPQVRATLEETRRLAGDLPWGVGILGFVPPELRAEQLDVVKEIRPPFALIAGGRPDQAAELDKLGIASFLHVPSPSLLETFLDQGARRFVFEGRECGGHVGPRTSFVLWEQVTAVLLEAIERGTPPEELHIVFAGGIHDARSAAMVAALAAPLFARGVRVGLLLGTAYLFTREAVTSGAIVEGFQARALDCEQTILLESGLGHATRCAPTPFAEEFRNERRKLLAAQTESGAVRDQLEALNVGRLRIASKGIERAPSGAQPSDSTYVSVDAERQARDGMYMIGQVAALRGKVVSMAELHEDVCEGSGKVLQAAAASAPRTSRKKRAPEPPCDVAIVGMACLLPDARNSQELWANLVAKHDAVGEVSKERFNIDLYYDQDRGARDKVYSRWGGFLNPVAFDPVRYGIPPNSLRSIDPMQLLSLVIVDQALGDAGYSEREFDRERTSVIFGMSGGLGDLGIKYAVRASLPQYLDGVPEEILAQLPEWTEDSFAGILMNVTSGRIANRFDFGGVNFTVDAACASSLAALYLGARELNHGGSDMVVVGGADTVQSPFGYLCFSSSKALSPRGKCSTFDAGADGIAISEGVAALILRRLDDAERDGDRIYAVVKGVQGSSDGRGRGLTAPLPAGQVRVLRRAYAQAGFSPSTVSLIEAHGTGTVAGDAAELESLTTVFREDEARPASCAVGSVKSMIGHTKSTAGVAGLMKVAQALYKGVQPPTLHVEEPNPQLRSEGSPFYVNVDAQPWASGGPKRAGVSSFGFGGTNFHAALEEYAGEFRPVADRPPTSAWPAELFFWEADSAESLAGRIETFLADVGADQALALAAAESWRRAGTGGRRAAIVAASRADLEDKCSQLAAALRQGASESSVPAGCFFSHETSGKLAVLFAGQGSQRPFMLRDLALRLPEMREALDEANRALEDRFDRPLSAFIYPPHPFSDEEKAAQKIAITDTSVAQPALGAVEVGLLRALERFGLSPDMTAGHSYGEYVALHAAGVIDAAALFALSSERGAIIKQSVGENPGAMVALSADGETAERIAAGLHGVVTANLNSPRQTVLAGPEEGIQETLERCAGEGVAARKLPVACAFHSPFMSDAANRFASVLRRTALGAPIRAVYSNTSAKAHPKDPARIVSLLEEHLTSPVRWAEQIERMYADGARVFLEIGPGGVLAQLSQQILGDRGDVTVLSCDGRGGAPTDAFRETLAALAALAVRGRLPHGRELFRGRTSRAANLATGDAPWRIDGGGAYPRGEQPKPAVPVRIPPSAVPPQRAVAPTYTPSQAPAPPAAHDDLERVMFEHNRLMEQFLTTQAELMSAYLGDPATSAAPRTVPSTESNGQTTETRPSAPTQETQPAEAIPTALCVVEELVRITSERTGYPPELLDANAALEADLGVDSIKRIEIIGAFQKTCSELERRRIGDAMDQLSGATSLNEMAAVLNELRDEGSVPPPTIEPDREPSEDPLPELVRITSERTGYPPEMLDPAAGLEADLGVDSIKRVEIIGAFQKSRTEAERRRIGDAMDQLSGARSMGELAARIAETLAPGAPASSQNAPPARLVLTTEERPRSTAAAFRPGRVTLIACERLDRAAEIAERLRQAGEKPVIVQRDPSVEAEGAIYAADLTDATDTARVLSCIRDEHGPINAVLHLIGLDVELEGSVDIRLRHAELRKAVRSVYLLARATFDDLAGGDAAHGKRFVAVTRRGGRFGLPRPDDGGSPSSTALADFVKSLAAEEPGFAYKVVDIGPKVTASELLEEFACDDTDLQVGLQEGRRWTVVPALDTLEPGRELELPAEPVFLITGGARGITSQVAKLAARRLGARLVLVGSTSLPDTEDQRTAKLQGADLKKAILSSLQGGGGPVRPVDVEAEYGTITRAREIRDTLEGLRLLGAVVEYCAVDVRDVSAFSTFLDDVYERYGRIDVVIHGAGVIEDKLVRDKSPESFDRVFDTKAVSSLVLARKLRPDSLRALVFMSSISAAFGNRGQADYAAANGVMNGLAQELAGPWRSRVTAINWGPWDQHGMVSEGVRQQFEERGIGLIPPDAGAAAVFAEIGREKLDPIVVIGDGPWTAGASSEGVSAWSRGGA